MYDAVALPDDALGLLYDDLPRLKDALWVLYDAVFALSAQNQRQERWLHNVAFATEAAKALAVQLASATRDLPMDLGCQTMKVYRMWCRHAARRIRS